MARHKIEDDLPYLVFQRMSWWVSLLTVAAAYVILQFIMPLALGRQNPFTQLFVIYAPYVTLILALYAVFAQAAHWKRRKLLDKQSSVDTIRTLSWHDFEKLVGEAYRQQGYRVEERGGAGPDGGVDLVLHRNDERILVQCKRWRTRQVGVSVVREHFGVMASEKATGGIIVVCGYFTPDAIAFARGKPLQLIGGAELLELVRRGQIQSPVTPRLVPFRPQPTPVPPGQVGKPVASDSKQPFCPVCRQPMLRKEARRGANAGSQFWGCPAYPRCRGTRQLE